VIILDTSRKYSRVFLPAVENTREVDFVVTEGKQLILMVEAKWNDSEIDRGLRSLKERFKTAVAWQVSAIGVKDYVSPEGIRVAPSIELLKTLV
jgi:predicted AAA+ superfamily ATPase